MKQHDKKSILVNGDDALFKPHLEITKKIDFRLCIVTINTTLLHINESFEHFHLSDCWVVPFNNSFSLMLWVVERILQPCKYNSEFPKLPFLYYKFFCYLSSSDDFDCLELKHVSHSQKYFPLRFLLIKVLKKIKF